MFVKNFKCSINTEERANKQRNIFFLVLYTGWFSWKMSCGRGFSPGLDVFSPIL